MHRTRTARRMTKKPNAFAACCQPRHNNVLKQAHRLDENKPRNSTTSDRPSTE